MNIHLEVTKQAPTLVSKASAILAAAFLTKSSKSADPLCTCSCDANSWL